MAKLEKSSTDQRHQLLKLQNRDPAHSFTDGRISCRDGYILVHYGVLMAGADPLSLSMFMNSLSYEEPTSRTIDATNWTVKEMSPVVLLFYLEKSRVTFHENNGAQMPPYFQNQLRVRLEALGADTTQVFSFMPLLLQDVRGLKRNRLLAKNSKSLDRKCLRFTRTDSHGNDCGDYLISTDGNTAPIHSSELTPPLLAADSSNDANRIGRPPVNLYVPSPIMCSTSIDHERNPSHSNSLSTGNNIKGVTDDSSRNKRMRRPSEVEADRENIASNPNKRSRRIENRHEEAFSSNRGRPLAPLINNIIPHSPPHNSHQGPRHVCKINRCGDIFSNVADLLGHTNHDHGLFKLRHYRLRTVPWCLICDSRKKFFQASPEDFTNHVYECLQNKRKELGAQWEPPLQGQTSIYSAVFDTTKWYEQLKDNPTSFTEEEYNQIIQEDNLSEGEGEWEDESESDDSLMSSADPEESVGNVLESSSDTEGEDELCLEIVTEDIAQRVLNSNF